MEPNLLEEIIQETTDVEVKSVAQGLFNLSLDPEELKEKLKEAGLFFNEKNLNDIEDKIN